MNGASQNRVVPHVNVADALVGSMGIMNGSEAVGIKGDPSLRDSAYDRPRQVSRMDAKLDAAIESCAWLLKDTGCYAIYIGFNSNEVRTESVFDPFNCEIHDIEQLLDHDYRVRHFVELPYKTKMQSVLSIRRGILAGNLAEYLPAHWAKLLNEKTANCSGMMPEKIDEILNTVKSLRRIENFFVRTVAISLTQCTVTASFNCDGTYVIAAKNFSEYIRDMTGVCPG